MSQKDILLQNLSKLSPTVQKTALDALRRGKYASINVYAKEKRGEYLQAKQYLDQFFNTPEGKRFGDQAVFNTAYNQLFNQPGRTNVTNVTPQQPLQSYIVGNQKISISEENLKKKIASGQIKAGGTYRNTQGQYLIYNLNQSVAQPTAADVLRNAINTQQQNLVSTPQGVVDVRSGRIIKRNYKLPITTKLENFYFKTGILNEKKYRAWESNALLKAQQFQNTLLSKNARAFWEYAKVPFTDLVINLPKALINLTIRSTQGIYSTIKNPKLIINYSTEELNKATNFVLNSLKKGYSKNDTPKKVLSNLLNTYVAYQVSKKNINSKVKKQILNNSVKYIKYVIKSQKSPKEIINFLANLTPEKVKKYATKAKEQINIASYTFLTNTLAGVQQIPAGFVDLVNNPKNVLKIPSQTIATGKEDITLLKTSPAAGIGKIGSDIFLIYLTDKGFEIGGRYVTKAKTRLNPYFRKFKDDVLKIKVPEESFVRRGNTVYLKKRVSLKPNIIDRIYGRKPGQFKKFQETPGIELKKGLLTDNSRTLAEQAKLAGTKGTIVTAQANRLVNFLRRKKIIRKPIPGEEDFTALTKALLKKFDEGKITKKEFYKLNRRVLKESGKTLLERSLYADPNGLIRFTRLGNAVNQASLRDIFRGNFTFKKSKPQVLVFPEGQIERFPKSIKDIVEKLKKNKKLTEKERARLIEFQIKKSGKWKPIGDTEYKGGIELEVTLAPGETIRRVKKLAVVEINGVPVEIVEAKIIKLSKESKRLLNKAKRGNIKLSEANKLRKLLEKETNLPVKLKDVVNLRKNITRNLRRRTLEKKYYPLARKLSSRAVSILRSKPKRKISPAQRKILLKRLAKARRVLARKKGRGKNKRIFSLNKKVPRKKTQRKAPRTSVRKASTKKRPPKVPRPPRRPSKKPPKRPISLPKGFRRKMLSNKQDSYYVIMRRKGKFVKLTAKPLILKDARDYLAYRLDNGLARTAFYIPIGRTNNVVGLPLQMRGYFNKVSNKLRPYKIRMGKKRTLVRGYIEKKKYSGDTKREIKQLQASRSKRKRITKVKRKSSTTRPKMRKKGIKKVRRTPIKRVTSKRPVKRKIRRKSAKLITKPKRKISPAQRKILLKRLAKARRVLAMKRKK